MKETAHVFGADRALFGIVTHPEAANTSRTGVILLNAGQVHHIGPNRIHVGIARHLAESGFISVRIDQSGKGESPARSGRSRTEALLQDFDDVEGHMSTLGIDKYVIFGLCSGADDALTISHQRPQVIGLALLDSFVAHTPLRYVDYVMRQFLSFDWVKNPPRNVLARLMKRLKRAAVQVDVRDWESPEIMNKYYRDFIDRDGKVIAIFTHGARYYTKCGQLARSIGSDRGLDEIYLKHASHTLCERANRESLYTLIPDWLSQKFADGGSGRDGQISRVHR